MKVVNLMYVHDFLFRNREKSSEKRVIGKLWDLIPAKKLGYFLLSDK